MVFEHLEPNNSYLKLLGISLGFQYKGKVVQRSLKYTTYYVMRINSHILRDINSVLEKVVMCQVESKGEVLLISTEYESADILAEFLLLLKTVNFCVVKL